MSLISKGNNNGGNNQPPVDQELINHNQQVYDYICSQKGIGKVTEKKLKEILDYCNENGLRMEDGKEFHSEDKYDKAIVSIIDPSLEDIQINIFKDMMVSANTHCITPETLSMVRTSLQNLPENFTILNGENLIYHVNLTNKSFDNNVKDVYGFFDPAKPQSIQLTNELLYKQSLTSLIDGSNSLRQVDVDRTIIHEIAHAFDYQVIGHWSGTGTPSVFTKYGGTPWSQSPTRYGQDDPSEVISTTIEQVYTHTLRSDALMRDGTSVRTYAKEHNIDTRDSEAMYNVWADDWKDLVKASEDILYDNYSRYHLPSSVEAESY